MGQPWPALPLFTLAGLVFARTGAAQRIGNLFVTLMGGGVHGTVLATAVLCSLFTAFTGGSGVTILALGGLLLPLLRNAGYPEQRGISLVTSASALGVLLAPSVPLIMVAIIARVPINTMFLAGLVPAALMVLSLLAFGGYLGKSVARVPVSAGGVAAVPPSRPSLQGALAASNSHFDFLMGSEAGFRSRNFQTWSYPSQMEPDCLGQTGGGPLC